MSRNVSRLVMTAAVVAAVGLWTNSARAQMLTVQRLSNGITISTYSVDPARYLDPYGIHRRNAYLLSLYGQAYSTVPPYALGYNPYGTYYNGPIYAGPTTPVYVSPYFPQVYGGYYYNPYYARRYRVHP